MMDVEIIKDLYANRESKQCSDCMLCHFCVPDALSVKELTKLPELIKHSIRIPKGEYLYQEGDEIEAIYSIRSGSIKTYIKDDQNHYQITGFFLPSELVGLEGLDEGVRHSFAMALEDTQVCVMNISDLDHLSEELPYLQKYFRQILSKEITRSQQVLLSVASLRSDQKIASFLLNISLRMKNLGYSPVHFHLRMSREDIGHYLGLTLETVSRILSRFSKEGLIHIQNKDVELLDVGGLYALLHDACV